MNPKTKKGINWTPPLVFLAFCVVATIGVIMNRNEMQTAKPKPTTRTSQVKSSVPKPTYHKPTATTQPTVTGDLDKQFSAWDGSHYKTVKHVKRVMKNPKSFKHVNTTYTPHKDKNYRVIVMQYRGTNSFNAVVTNTIFVQVKLNGDVVKVISQL